MYQQHRSAVPLVARRPAPSGFLHFTTPLAQAKIQTLNQQTSKLKFVGDTRITTWKRKDISQHKLLNSTLFSTSVRTHPDGSQQFEIIFLSVRTTPIVFKYFPPDLSPRGTSLGATFGGQQDVNYRFWVRVRTNWF